MKKAYSLGRGLILSFIVVLLWPQIALAEVGTVVALTSPAEAKTENGRIRLSVGTELVMGDVIRTGQNGEVQVEFPDKTRVVVGPNSQLVLQRIKFRNNGTARRFRVSAVVGTFRVLTGDSPKRAYQVRTPTATMAVRGTEFDFSVSADTRDTTLVVHDGLVKLCDYGGRCVDIPRGCQMAKLDRLRRFTQPKTREERAEILRMIFPYARSDAHLDALFQARIDSCSESDRGGQSASAATEEEALPQLDLPPDPKPKDDDNKRKNPAL